MDDTTPISITLPYGVWRHLLPVLLDYQATEGYNPQTTPPVDLLSRLSAAGDLYREIENIEDPDDMAAVRETHQVVIVSKDGTIILGDDAVIVSATPEQIDSLESMPDSERYTLAEMFCPEQKD